MRRGSSRRSRGVDLLLCFVVAGGVAAAVTGIAWVMGGEAFVRWGGLVGFSCLLFWAVIRAAREVEKQPINGAFLIFNLCFITAHAAAWGVLISHAPVWKIPWFALMVPEALAYLWLYAQLFHDKPWRRLAVRGRR